MGLVLLLATGLVLALRQELTGPVAQFLSAAAAAYMAGNGLEHFAASRVAPPPAAPSNVGEQHTGLLQGITKQLGDLTGGVVELLKKP